MLTQASLQTDRSPIGEAAMQPEPKPLPVGFRLRKYKIQPVLARGAFAITYVGRDLKTKQRVAIKEYAPGGLVIRGKGQNIALGANSHTEAFEQGLREFGSRAKALSKIKHPNLAHILKTFEENSTIYAVMEYEKGEKLSKFFDCGQMRTEKDLLAIFLPLLDGLSAIHEIGLVHRDIRPDNILVRGDGSPVLLDFGATRQGIDYSAASAGFTPPEQYRDYAGQQGPWSDIYALGATIYKGVTSKPPAHALARCRARDNGETDPYQPAVFVAASAYSPGFLRAIDKSLTLQSDQRPRRTNTWSRMLDGRASQSLSKVKQVAKSTGSTNQSYNAPEKRAQTGRTPPGLAARISAIRGIQPNIKMMTVVAALGVGVAAALTPVWLDPPATDAAAPVSSELKIELATDTQEPPLPDSAADRQKLITHYRGLAETAMDNRELDLAESILQNIERIDPQSIVLTEARERLAQRKLEIGEAELQKREAEEERIVQQALEEAVRKEREALRLAEQARAAEQARQEAERREQEARRIAEEQRAAEEAQRKEQEARRLAEEQRLAEEARRKEQEEQRLAEERRAAEEARQQEAQRKEREAQRLAEEQRAIEEARRRKQEEQRLAEERRAAEEARLQQEAEQVAILATFESSPEPGEIETQRTLRATDTNLVGGYMDQFKIAFQQRNIEELAKISRLTRDKRQLAQQIFAQYDAVEVSISELAWFERTEQVSARMTIDRLITKGGDAVIPGPAWKHSRLVMRKKDGAWQKIEW